MAEAFQEDFVDFKRALYEYKRLQRGYKKEQEVTVDLSYLLLKQADAVLKRGAKMCGTVLPERLLTNVANNLVTKKEEEVQDGGQAHRESPEPEVKHLSVKLLQAY